MDGLSYNFHISVISMLMSVDLFKLRFFSGSYMTSDFFTKCLNLGYYIMKRWSLSKSLILANISHTMMMEGRKGHCLIFTTQFSLTWRGRGREEGFLVTAGWRWKFRLPPKPPYWYHPGWDQQGCLITTPHVTSADTMGRERCS